MTERRHTVDIDPFNLDRFVQAQLGTYSQALAEIQRGEKRSHWMWFIFPQLTGLGRSYESQFYGISGLDEARYYLTHDILGSRLRDCVSTLLELQHLTARQIFGPTDEMKLRSSMTLFETVSDELVFKDALEKYFGGGRDELTLEILRNKDQFS
jgi:uncharacterized protein (DUF1810 family)